MSEPPVVPTDTSGAPAPFAARPIEPRGGGCSKPALVGCGVLFLLLGVAGLVFVLKAKGMLVWSLEKVEAGILGNLPGDMTEGDRDRFTAAFTSAKTAIENGKIDPAALQALPRELMKAVQQPKGKLTREQILDLTMALERLGGVATPGVAPPGTGEVPLEGSPEETEPSSPASEPGRQPAPTSTA